MGTIMRAAAFAAAAVAIVAIPPLVVTANARGGGFGGHGGRFHADHRGVFGVWPAYGTPLDYPLYGVSRVAPQPVVYVPQLPVLSCHYSEQVVTVPAEAGGTKDITIRRC
jgi:hypothetical protein